MTPIYEFTSKHFTPARVGNTKSKIIEPYFKYLNKEYCQIEINWSGFGVKSKIQPNPEAMNKLRTNYPDKAGARRQLENFIATERAKKLEAYCNAYDATPKDRLEIMSQEEYLMYFGETTGFTNRLNQSGITPKIKGVQYAYDTFDLEFRSHL